MRLLFAILLAFAVAADASASAPTHRHVAVVRGALAQGLDAQLTEAARVRGFGGAMVVEIDGKLVLKGGWGLASRERGVPFTADTPAQIGSITKAFTGLLASQLMAEGKLDPEAPLRTYLPDAPEPAASATINQLLTHTAGLSDYCGDDFEPRTRAALISDCMARPLEFPVGSYNYSNMGISFVAAAMEQVTGQSWEDALRRRVWSPFGMQNTGWTFGRRATTGFANGYLEDQPQGIISDRISALNGADWNLKGNGGLQASAADMYRFYRGIMLQPAAVRSIMLQSHGAGRSPDVKEGYGLFFRLDAAGTPWRVGHSGSDGTFFSYFAWYPEKHAFFYFVGNNGEEPVTTELQGVLRIVETSLGVRPAPKPAS